MLEITRLTAATQSSLDELLALGRELHADNRTMSLSSLEELLADESAIMMVIKDDGRIIGMATLYIIPKIGKKNGLLEDVIVASQYRGQGLGERLVREVLAVAKAQGLASVTLTSNPVRIAAHKLYEKVGFVKKDSEVLRVSL